MPAGSLIQLAVEQDGVDATARLFGPGGVLLTRVDSPTGAAGEETVLAVTGRDGRHRLLVEGIGSAAGRYRVRMEAVRPADATDRQRAYAAGAFAEAEWLSMAGGHGDAEEIVLLYYGAYDAYRILGDEPGREALARARLGRALAAVGRWWVAGEHLRAGAEALAAAGLEAEAAGALDDLGNLLRRTGHPGRAEAALRAAIAADRALGRPGGEAAALNDLGRVYEVAGDLEAAIESYEQSLAVRRTAGLPEAPAPLHNLGFAYGRIGYTEEAFDFLRRALALAEELKLPKNQADSLLALGWFTALDIDPAEALPYYRRAETLIEELDDLGRQATLLDWRSSALADLGRYDEAEAGYREALALAEDRRDATGQRAILINLALLELRRERPEAARRLLERARGIEAGAGDPAAEAALLSGLAATERSAGRLDAAWGHLEQALELLEGVRATLPRDTARALYLSVRREIYDRAVELLMELSARDGGAWHLRALEVSERFRARGLAEALAAAPAGEPATADGETSGEDAAGGGEAESRARERELLQKVAATEAAWLTASQEERTGEAAARLGRELRGLWLEIERLRAAMRDPEPAPAPDPLGADAIAALLDPGVQLLVYHLADETSRLWVISAGGDVVPVELPGRERIEPLALDFAKTLPESAGKGPAAQERALAAALTEVVLAPAAPYLTGRRLAVVPDGALHLVPFAALLDPGAVEADGPRRLIERFDLAVLPSASVLALQRRAAAGRSRPPGRVAVIADPVYGPDDPRLGGRAGVSEPLATAEPDLRRAARDLRLDRLDRLPYTAIEAAAILRAAGPGARTRRLVDFDASAEALRSGELSGFEVVHVAGHGLLDPVHPELSGVVFSLFDAAGHPIDGFVRARELRSLELPAELVVLSACRTALGRELKAEGLIGLPHALFEAGARRVVASYWDVGDEATAELMAGFYRAHLRDGAPPAAALARAQRAMLADPRWRAPAHWAGFALHGDWR